MNPDAHLKASPLSIHNVIESRLISSLYQPIVRLQDGTVVGYEALSRGPRNTSFESPLVLLSEAEKNNCLWDLEILLRKVAIEGAANLDVGQALFLNVDPRIINDPAFHKGLTREYLESQQMSPTSIIFEITERYAIKDHQAFDKVLSNYREQGYQMFTLEAFNQSATEVACPELRLA